MLPPTPTRSHPPGRHRHQPNTRPATFWMQTAVIGPCFTAVCIQNGELKQRGGESAAQWAGEVSAAAFLVGQQRGTQPATVGAQRVHRRASRATRRIDPHWGAQEPRTVRAQQRSGLRATTAFDGQQQIQQRPQHLTERASGPPSRPPAAGSCAQGSWPSPLPRCGACAGDSARVWLSPGTGVPSPVRSRRARVPTPLGCPNTPIIRWRLPPAPHGRVRRRLR